MFDIAYKTSIKSLLKRKTRSLLVVVMIAMSLWGVLVMQGYYDGMMNQMIKNAIKTDSGHVTLYAKGFRQEKLLTQQIHDEKAVLASLKREHFESISRILQEGLLSTAHYSRSVMIVGIDLNREKKFGDLESYIIQGEYGFGKKENGVIIGHTLAKKMKLSVGKSVVFSAQNAQKEVVSLKGKITGIIQTHNLAFDEQGVFISLSQAKKFFGISGVTQISFMLEEDSHRSRVKEKLESSDFEAFTWEELYPALLQSKEYMDYYNLIAYFLITIITTIGIFGVMLVSVLERLREFAVMMAIGTQLKEVALMVFIEASILGLAGFISGSLLGLSTLLYLHFFGLDLASFSEEFALFGMDSITYASISFRYFIMAFVSVFSAILLSILFPIRVLKKTKPAEVIKDE